jgi:hypothetical protein
VGSGAKRAVAAAVHGGDHAASGNTWKIYDMLHAHTVLGYATEN